MQFAFEGEEMTTDMAVKYSIPRNSEVTLPGLEEILLDAVEWRRRMGGQWFSFLGTPEMWADPGVFGEDFGKNVKRKPEPDRRFIASLKPVIGEGRLVYSEVGIIFLAKSFYIAYDEFIVDLLGNLVVSGVGLMTGHLFETLHMAHSANEFSKEYADYKRKTYDLLTHFKKTKSFCIPYNGIVEARLIRKQWGRQVLGLLPPEHRDHFVITHEDMNGNRTSYTFLFTARGVPKPLGAKDSYDLAEYLMEYRIRADIRALTDQIRYQAIDFSSILASMLEKYKNKYRGNMGPNELGEFERELTDAMWKGCDEAGLTDQKIFSLLLERLSPLMPYYKTVPLERGISDNLLAGIETGARGKSDGFKAEGWTLEGAYCRGQLPSNILEQLGQSADQH
jgi:hypothetical protein